MAALGALYDRPGPYASVYISVRATGEEDVRPRWRALAAELTRLGGGDRLVETVRERVFAEVPGPGVLAVFATDAISGGAADSKVVLTMSMPGSAQPDLARYDTLPHLVPVVEWLQDRPGFVSAVVDRTGADITLHPGGTAIPLSRTVVGPDDEIERNAPGGWSQGRYQRRAEDSWAHNAAAVVETLAPLVRRHPVPLLVLAGDVRMLQYVEKQLPAAMTRQVAIRHVSGSRSPDGAAALRAEQIAEEVRRTVAECTASLLAEFDEERAPGGRAVEGAAPTLDAFRESRVATLLLARPVANSRTAWFGTDPTAVAVKREDLEMASVRPLRAALVDVAVRAALLTRAEVRILSDVAALEAPAEGIGALCRFPSSTS